MATVGVGVITRANSITALAPNPASAAGDAFPAGADVWLYLANSSGAPITVTVATPATVRGLAVEDLPIVVPAGGYAVRGPWPADAFAGPAGLANLTYSTHIGLTFGAWKVGA